MTYWWNLPLNIPRWAALSCRNHPVRYAVHFMHSTHTGLLFPFCLPDTRFISDYNFLPLHPSVYAELRPQHEKIESWISNVILRLTAKSSIASIKNYDTSGGTPQLQLRHLANLSIKFHVCSHRIIHYKPDFSNNTLWISPKISPTSWKFTHEHLQISLRSRNGIYKHTIWYVINVNRRVAIDKLHVKLNFTAGCSAELHNRIRDDLNSEHLAMASSQKLPTKWSTFDKHNVLMTIEMHNSYNQFLFHSFFVCCIT